MRISDWSSDVCSSDLKENVIVGRLIPAGTGAAMNRARVTASSTDAALRAAMRVATEAQLVAPETAAEEHAAQLAQGPEAAIADDPLGKVPGADVSPDEGMVEERPEGGEAD